MSLDVTLTAPHGDEVYWSNITHNLNKMAREIGIYKELWYPDEIGITKASQLIEPLLAGLMEMVKRPTHFQQFNSPNGWGMYHNFLPWVSNYLEACINNPDADVSVSR